VRVVMGILSLNGCSGGKRAVYNRNKLNSLSRSVKFLQQTDDVVHAKEVVVSHVTGLPGSTYIKLGFRGRRRGIILDGTYKSEKGALIGQPLLSLKVLA